MSGHIAAFGDREYLIGELPIAKRDWIIERIGPLFIAAAEAADPPASGEDELQAIERHAQLIPEVFDQLPEDELRKLFQSCIDVCHVRCNGEWTSLPAPDYSSPDDFGVRLFVVLQVINRSVIVLTQQLQTFAALGSQTVGSA